MAKRRRLDVRSPSADANEGDAFLSPIDEAQTGSGHGFENIDPFLSPATASSWPYDEFAHDPNYLASQEVLRSLMFTTARSVVPTRAGTPMDGDDGAGTMNIKCVLADGRHIQYLKNYISHVAPWVSLAPWFILFDLEGPS